jgi:hypothetical protein
MNISKDIIGIVYKYLLPNIESVRNIKNDCLYELSYKTLSIFYDLSFSKDKFVRYCVYNKKFYLSRFK